MAVAQRHSDRASLVQGAADRLEAAIDDEVEVHVVNRQICVVLTPRAADALSARLAAPRRRDEAVRVERTESTASVERPEPQDRTEPPELAMPQLELRRVEVRSAGVRRRRTPDVLARLRGAVRDEVAWYRDS